MKVVDLKNLEQFSHRDENGKLVCQCFGHEFNFIVGDVEWPLVESIFGPFDKWDALFLLPNHVTWGDLLVLTGVVKSKTRARKQGMEKDIAPGFSHKRIKSKFFTIFVLKEF